MNLSPLPSAPPDTPQVGTPATSQTESRPRRFARLLETALTLFFPAGEPTTTNASSENSTCSGCEPLLKTPEEPAPSPSPNGEKPRLNHDQKSTRPVSLTPEVASVPAGGATTSLPDTSPPSSYSATSVQTTASDGAIEAAITSRDKTNISVPSLPAVSSIASDEPALSERALDETTPEILDVRVATLRESQKIGAKAAPEAPAPSDGARFTQATATQTQHKIAPQQLDQVAMQRPPAMTPENALGSAQARRSPAPVATESAGHGSQQPSVLPDRNQVPTHQSVGNGSATSTRTVNLDAALGIRIVHLQTNLDTDHQKTATTKFPESPPAPWMHAETAPQRKSAQEPHPVLSITLEAHEPVNVSAQTPADAAAAPATAVHQKNHASQNQPLPGTFHDDPSAASTPLQQSHPTPPSSHFLRVSSETSHRQPAQKPTDRSDALTTSDYRPAKPPTPEPDTARLETNHAFRQTSQTDTSQDEQPTSEGIDRLLNASSPATSPPPPATVLPRVIRTAAWFQIAMAFAERVRQHVDGQMLEVELSDGEGTLRIETRRHPDHVVVSVQLSDPQLRALVAAHADRIQEALQAQYQTAVQFSLSGGGDQNARQQQPFAQATTHGTPLASGSDTSGPVPAESARIRVLHPGSQHEWIG